MSYRARAKSWHTTSAIVILLFLVGAGGSAIIEAQPTAGVERMPVFDDEGRLRFPADYRTWVFAGASKGLSYSEGSGGMEMFHETLIEPGAYQHFVRTGTFRDGTMLALLLHDVGEQVMPQRRGSFAGPLRAVEIAVKSAEHFEGGWGYFGFSQRRGQDVARAFGHEQCAACHREHGATDNVFTQFYPVLTSSAGPALASARSRASATENAGLETSEAEPAEETEPEVPVALSGFDPVMLLEGRDEEGKPEIIMVHDGFEYRFVSESNRKRFEADPARYSYQNETCLMSPGAAIDGDFFAVHQDRIYGFATRGCLDDFEADPEAAIAAWKTEQ